MKYTKFWLLVVTLGYILWMLINKLLFKTDKVSFNTPKNHLNYLKTYNEKRLNKLKSLKSTKEISNKKKIYKSKIDKLKNDLDDINLLEESSNKKLEDEINNSM